MHRWKTALVALLIPLIGVAAAMPAIADTEDSSAANAQEGDNEGDSGQDLEGHSGDAVAGQVGGIVSSGDTSVDSTNVSRDVNVESGDVDATADSAAFAGQNVSNLAGVGSVATATAADIDGGGNAFVNLQEGDNAYSNAQTIDANSGDAVAGQVIGVVNSGGTTDAVVDNISEDVDASTGDATADAVGAAFVGLNASTILAVDAASIGNVAVAVNVQEGDNAGSLSQTLGVGSGDAVGGQVVGVVSAGDTSIDATNLSTDVDAETGDAYAEAAGAQFAGLNTSNVAAVGAGALPAATATAGAAEIEDVGAAANVMVGDNANSFTQNLSAASGDAVGGQVIGAVTAAGGSTDIVADNTSEDADVETGDANAFADAAAFVGQNLSNTLNVGAGAAPAATSTAAASETIANIGTAANVMIGDNNGSLTQTSDASTGDAVGGQVIGAVSSGDTSIDATNLSEDVVVETGDATSDATAAYFVGQNVSNVVAIGAGAAPVATGTARAAEDFTIDGVNAVNVGLGDESAGAYFGDTLDATQDSIASTGDGVGGQVIGAVTASGGSTDVVADNTSTDVDAETGEADAMTALAAFVGHNASDALAVQPAGDNTISNVDATNVQFGDNALSGAQISDASTGDAVGGQVLGVVSAGDTSLDATNVSDDVGVETGEAVADATAAAFVGLNETGATLVSAAGDDTISGVDAVNIQEGSNAHSLSQSATAGSGDAVGGQVQGVVTATTGSVDAVIDNTSEDADAETGEVNIVDTDQAFIGLNFSDTTVVGL